MPAMCYYFSGRSGSICWLDVDCQKKELAFIRYARDYCQFFREPFKPENLERYLPYWETDDMSAVYLERFDWPENKRASQLDLFD